MIDTPEIQKVVKPENVSNIKMEAIHNNTNNIDSKKNIVKTEQSENKSMIEQIQSRFKITKIISVFVCCLILVACGIA